jgi:hypothetical protein
MNTNTNTNTNTIQGIELYTSTNQHFCLRMNTCAHQLQLERETPRWNPQVRLSRIGTPSGTKRRGVCQGSWAKLGREPRLTSLLTTSMNEGRRVSTGIRLQYFAVSYEMGCLQDIFSHRNGNGAGIHSSDVQTTQS